MYSTIFSIRFFTSYAIRKRFHFTFVSLSAFHLDPQDACASSLKFFSSRADFSGDHCKASRFSLFPNFIEKRVAVFTVVGLVVTPWRYPKSFHPGGKEEEGLTSFQAKPSPPLHRKEV
jgi:hypothetical protein